MIDLPTVITNAQAEWIDFRSIALIYEGLTPEETLVLSQAKLMVIWDRPENGATPVVGRFKADGTALFPEKVKSVYCLSA